MDFEDRHGGPADPAGHHLATTSPTSRRTATSAAHAVFEDLMYQNLRQAGASSSEQTTLPTGLQVGPGHARRRDLAQLQPGQPAAEQQPARHRDPRQRLLPDPDARRHHRLHPRRLVPGRARRGQLVTNNGYTRAARHHHPGQRAERDDRQRRHRQRACCRARPLPQTRRPAAARQLRQPGRPRAQGPEPLRRDRRLGHAERRHARASTAWARCSRASSRPRTSTSSRSWWR